MIQERVEYRVQVRHILAVRPGLEPVKSVLSVYRGSLRAFIRFHTGSIGNSLLDPLGYPGNQAVVTKFNSVYNLL